jgi:hypothetical protein
MPKKVKLTLETGHSYLVFDKESWEYLYYTIASIASQWGEDTQEHSDWMDWLSSLESQYLENFVEEDYDDEGWI